MTNDKSNPKPKYQIFWHLDFGIDLKLEICHWDLKN
jgi:hypothetical protein